MIDFITLLVIHLACILFWFWAVLVLAILLPVPALVVLWIGVSALSAWYVKGLR